MTAQMVPTPPRCGPVSRWASTTWRRRARVLDVPLVRAPRQGTDAVRCPAATAPCTWLSSPRTTAIRPTAATPCGTADLHQRSARVASGCLVGRIPASLGAAAPRGAARLAPDAEHPEAAALNARFHQAHRADRWTQPPGAAGWPPKWHSRWRCAPRQARTTSWRCDSTDTRGNRSGSPRTVTSCSPPAGWWAAAPALAPPVGHDLLLDAD